MNLIRMIVISILLVLPLFFLTPDGYAKNTRGNKNSKKQRSTNPQAQATREPASMQGLTASANAKEVDKPLKINGQSRNLNMMMTLKGEADQIGFVAPRKDFKDKIPKTHY